jgi:hypothetical protein
MDKKKIFISGFILLGFLLAIFLIEKNVVLAQVNKLPQSFLYLTWESDGIVPIDYQAKALPAQLAVIKVSVQPLIYSKGAYLNSDNWNYRWYIDNDLIHEGVGLKEIRFTADKFNGNSYVVKVKVLSPASSTPFEKSITINLANPLVFIKNSDTNNIIINTGVVNGDVIKLEAVPFFFSSYDANKFNYKWTINNKREIDLDDKKEIFVFNLEDNLETFPVKLVVEDVGKFIVRAETAININFVK